MSQDKLMQPRASIACWNAQASNGKGVSYDIVTVLWLGRVQHESRAMFEQQMRLLFGDAKGAVE